MTSLESFVCCPRCHGALAHEGSTLRCSHCNLRWPITNGIPKFVEGELHENFAIQWKRFSDVQLDSKNHTSCSRDRLLSQSGLSPEDFKGKTILEVGCGAGRFTEILLGFGASVIAVDYSAAVEACAASNQAARSDGRLWNAQADVFALPFKRAAFDIVLGYGMLQHTGDPRRALHALWEHVRPGGMLLADRYQLSLRCVLPIKYTVRPLFKRLPPSMVLSLAERTCELLVPAQRALLRATKGKGLVRFIRHAIGRSPNSVYPLNLEIAGVLDRDTAFRWCVLDTFDMWAPQFDSPQTLSGWKSDLKHLEGGDVILCKDDGQGNVGVIRRKG